MPEAKDHSLGALIDKIGANQEITEFCPELKWHDALFDSVASLVLLKELLNRFGENTIYQEMMKFWSAFIDFCLYKLISLKLLLILTYLIMVVIILVIILLIIDIYGRYWQLFVLSDY